VIDENSTLEDVCFEIAAVLQHSSIDAVLTGGSAATIYTSSIYTSLDADFVLRDHASRAKLAEALRSAGYLPSASTGEFKHPNSSYTIDFPKGPLAVGGDYVKRVASRYRGSVELRILTPTDCVKDRLAHFYYWNDATALEAAIAVARSNRSDVDVDELARWTDQKSQAGIDFRPKLAQFQERSGLKFPNTDASAPGEAAGGGGCTAIPSDAFL
jgi:hypothetical protein